MLFLYYLIILMKHITYSSSTLSCFQLFTFEHFMVNSRDQFVQLRKMHPCIIHFTNSSLNSVCCRKQTRGLKMRCPIKIPFLQYSELSIDGTEQISGKIRAGQNFPETNLLLENGNLSKIFKCTVQLICWDFLRRESPETGLKGTQL